MGPVKKPKPAKAKKNASAAAVANTEVAPEAEEAPPAVVSGQLMKRMKKQVKRQKRIAAKQRGVVFIKHLPHGFFEQQLQRYFEQFGTVTRLRLARSSRTGGSKGFAFVEFQFPEVAQVAADTMNNYLMFKKLVKASYIPPEQQCFNYFRTSLRKVKNKVGKEIYVSKKTAAILRKANEHNDWSAENHRKRSLAKIKKIRALNEKYKHLGLDFSKILVHSDKLKDSIVGMQEDELEKAEQQNNEASGTKSERAVGKRKAAKSKVEATQKSKSKKLEKPKSVSELADLLGKTISDDEEDEDYEDEEQEASSDEETYGFTKDADSDENDSDLNADSDEDDDTHEIVSSAAKTTKSTRKLRNVERFDLLTKRKPALGRIGKQKSAAKAPVPAKKAKKALQVAAAKEVAKPLIKIKGNKANLQMKSKVGAKKKKRA